MLGRSRRRVIPGYADDTREPLARSFVVPKSHRYKVIAVNLDGTCSTRAELRTSATSVRSAQRHERECT